MRMLNFMNRKNIFTALLALYSLAFFSCGENSGLGSEIDTEAPKISITYPPASSIIRENFEFGGTWTDDKVINSITVTVEKIISDNKKEVVYTGSATINPDGSWITTLDAYDENNSSYYNGWQFSDGSYEISVVAKDAAGNKSGTASRGYSIDNTAPVLVLTKPTSVGSNTPKAYGRTVQLEGTFSEACSSGISKLTVSFFDKSGNGLFDCSFEGISDMSDANPLVVAKYFESEPSSADDKKLWENYKVLYPDWENYDPDSEAMADTESLYFTVTATDDAKIYRNFENLEYDATPNATTSYYRGTNEMLTLIKNQNTNFKGFTVLSLKNYLNKTDSSYFGNEELKEIVTSAVSESSLAKAGGVAASIADSVSNTSTSSENGDSQKVYLNLSINPQNNPTYTVSSFALKSEGDEDNYTGIFHNYLAGSDMGISFDRGLDGSNFRTSSISVYYYEVDGDGNPVDSDGNEITATENIPKKLFWTYNEDVAVEYAREENPSLSDEELHTLVTASESSASQYRYTITSSDANSVDFSLTASLSTAEITTGKKYLFTVDGADIDGQNIIKSASLGFGFYAKSTSAVPVIRLDQNEGNKNKENLASFTKKTFEEEKISFSGTIETEQKFDESDPKVSYTLTLTDSTSSETKSLTVWAKDWELFEHRQNTGFTYDWNFLINPSQDIMDFISSENGLYTVDVTLTAENNAGKYSLTRTYYLDTKESVFMNIALTKEKGDKTSAYLSSQEDSSKTYYLNNTAGNTFCITGTVTDNYKIASTMYKISGRDSSGNEKNIFLPEEEYTSSMNLDFTGLDLSAFSAQNNADDAKIEIITTDLAGNQAEYELYIEFDRLPPVWKNDDENYPFLVNKNAYSSDNWYKDSSIPVSGAFVESGSGTADIYYWVQLPGGKSPDTTNFASASSFKASNDFEKGLSYFTDQILGSFEASVLENDSVKSNTLYIVAVDNVGNSGSSAQGGILINLDVLGPSIGSDKNGMVYTNQISDISVSGSYSDNASGLNSIFLNLNGNSVKASLDEESKTWAATFKAADEIFSGLDAEKEYNVNATATDKAGNTASSTLFTVQVDKEAPDVTLSSPAKDSILYSSVKLSGGVSYDKASPASLKFCYSLSGPVSGSSESATSLESLLPLPVEKYEFTGSEIYGWSVENLNVRELSGLTEAEPSKEIYIIPVLYDEAGNCNIYTESRDGRKTYSYSQDRNFFKYRVDQNKDRPVIKISNIANADSWLKSIKLSGSISDEDGIAGMEIAVKYKDQSDFSAYKSASVSNGSWIYEFDSDPTKESADIQIKFRVEDSAKRIFDTDKTSLFERPYYTYSETSESDYQTINSFTDYGFDNASPLTIKLDTASPAIYTPGISIAETADELADASSVSENIDDYRGSLLKFAGGNKKFIKFYAPVFDPNMKVVTYKITDSEGNEISASNSTGDLSKTATKITNGSTEYTYWESPEIDISGYASGAKNVVITAIDAATNETGQQMSFSVDNDMPEVPGSLSPGENESLTGDVNISGTVSDRGCGSVSMVEWLVPPASHTDSAGDEIVGRYEGWTKANNTSLSSTSFSFAFVTGTTYDLSNFEAKDSSGNYLYAVTENADNTFRVPFFLRITDKLGNQRIYRKYHITHNPDGDRPITELSSPGKKDYDTGEDGKSLGYITLSGSIQVTGSIEIPSLTCEAGMVYVQIGKVSDDNSVTWNQSDFAKEIDSNGGADSTESEVIDRIKSINSYASSVEYMPDDFWGIPATLKSSSWSIILNSNGNLDPSEETVNGETKTIPNKIAVRVCGVNENGKFGIWTDAVNIHVDDQAPSQSGEIREYKDDVTINKDTFDLADNIRLAKDYSSGMYIRGTKYFVVTISDNDSIKTSSVKVKRGSTALDDSEVYKTSVSGGNDSSATMKICIPIVSAGLGKSVSYTVDVTDESGHASKMTYTFSIDNTAPDITSLDDGSDSFLGESLPVIKNSDYRFTMNANVSETGSGFDKFFFYLLRTDADKESNPRILDPMLQFNEESPAVGEYNYETTKTAYLSQYKLSQKDVDSENGTEATLYGKTYEGSLDEARSTFTASGISADSHVRAGGLIYIAGQYQVIKSKNGDSVTFDNAVPKSLGQVTEAGFPYGQVIDNTRESKTWNSSNKKYDITNDDGDEMPETVKKSGTNWSLNVNLYSDKMTDGPVTLVCVVFDKAGNILVKEIETSVQNNAPRLAKLHLGTDLSGDGKYSDSEFNTYTFVTANAGKVSHYEQNVNFATAGTDYANYKTPFIIKNGLAVVPEITGGNGTVKMAFLKDASSDTKYKKQEEATALYETDTASLVKASFSSVYTNSVTNTADKTLNFVINDTNLTSVADGTGKAMSFTFWDSTEGTTCGADSNYCFVRVSDFTVDLVDGNAPKSVIAPFYWNSLNDNSIYGSSEKNTDGTSYKVSAYSDLQGHIELEKDWVKENDTDTNFASGYSSSATDGISDGDPKVSGKITLKGYAYDDQRLSSLWISFDEFTPANSLGTETRTVEEKTFYEVASYTTGDGTWKTATATMKEDGWCFSVDSTASSGAYLSQSGHKVFWTLSVDTEKIENTAQKDVVALVIALDRGGNVVSLTSATTTKTDASYNVPTYQMDVVPYITEVVTSLSSTNSNNPTAFSRSSLGHYPVYMTQAGNFVEADATKETVTLKGFNLGSASVETTVTFANDDKTDNTEATTKYKSDAWKFALPAGAKSGHIKVSVNGIESLNNTNNDDACGDYDYANDSTVDSSETANLSTVGSNAIYKNFYNRQPNDANNNRLTDDVYIDVWQFNSAAAKPTSSSALDIMMKVNPYNGMIGFAFCDGPLNFSMPKSDNSASYGQSKSGADFFKCTGFAYDGTGKPYATAAPGESDQDKADVYYFYAGDRAWGVGFTAVDSYANMAKDRFRSPSIAVTSDGMGAYLAYFDLLTGEIRFMGGLKGDKGWGTLANNYSGYYALKSLSAERALVQVVANGNNNTQEDGKGTALLGYSGEYVSIGIASNHVVMCWYDSKNGNLRYAYSTDENFTPGTGVNSTGWTSGGTLLDGAGKYCQLATASDGSVHIACFDNANGDLKYVYLSDYKGESKKTCTVDSYLSVGKELTIDVAGLTVGSGDNAKTYQIPHIGYYGTTPKKARYASLAEPEKFYKETSETAATNGALDDVYTGVWDCSILPSASKITQDSKTRRINVGVWKTPKTTTDVGGVLKNSVPGISSASAGSGSCYGNGTSNALLAYGVVHSSTQDYVETAQKR